MQQRKHYTVGQEIGWLTITCEAEKDKHGHRQFGVQCRCGKRYVVNSSFLGKKEPKCWECSHTYDMSRRRLPIVGRQINGWMVLDCVGRFENTYIYECRCEHCGHISYKTAGELSASKGGDCQYCRPDYHFQIHGNYAVGTLTNGRAFIIDTVMVTQVKKRRWRQDAKGYIVSFDNGEKIFLHRFVLGRTNAESICVDHINRSKSDCRSSNLRVVSLQQNAMNRSIGKNNTSGYVGVCYDKRGQRFVARIGLNNHYYFLGSSVDAIQCAQMYNYVAQQIFRQFAGHQNDVPPISEKLRKKMDQKLAPLILSAEIATNPV